jgi:hypothetical protein
MFKAHTGHGWCYRCATVGVWPAFCWLLGCLTRYLRLWWRHEGILQVFELLRQLLDLRQRLQLPRLHRVQRWPCDEAMATSKNVKLSSTARLLVAVGRPLARNTVS